MNQSLWSPLESYPNYASVRWEHGYMSPAYVGCTAGRLTEVNVF
jgi:hypothetical protein